MGGSAPLPCIAGLQLVFCLCCWVGTQPQVAVPAPGNSLGLLKLRRDLDALSWPAAWSGPAEDMVSLPKVSTTSRTTVAFARKDPCQPPLMGEEAGPPWECPLTCGRPSSPVTACLGICLLERLTCFQPHTLNGQVRWHCAGSTVAMPLTHLSSHSLYFWPRGSLTTLGCLIGLLQSP